MIKRFLLAVQLLTKIPIVWHLDVNEEDFGRSMVYYPLVGSIIGGILILLNLGSSKLFSSLTSNILVVVVWIYLTGGLHLDGFADMADGIAGGRDKDSILRIMRDSSIGAKGAVAVFCLLAIKIGFLDEISTSFRNQSLLFCPMLGRWAMVLISVVNRYARSEGGMGKIFVENVRKIDLVVATAIIAVPLFFSQNVTMIFPLIAALMTVAIVTYISRKKIDGITGDIIGATSEITEVVAIVTIAISAQILRVIT